MQGVELYTSTHVKMFSTPSQFSSHAIYGLRGLPFLFSLPRVEIMIPLSVTEETASKEGNREK